MTLRDLWDVVPRNHMIVYIAKSTADWMAVIRGEKAGKWIPVTDGRGPLLNGKSGYDDRTVVDVSTDYHPNYGTRVRVVIT